MVPKFEMSSHRADGILHLQLAGEFDGSSACELVNKIKEDCFGASRVLVDTTGIQSVHPFGIIVLRNSLGQVTRRLIGLTFTGKHKNQFGQ
jgi:hypothetical protein